MFSPLWVGADCPPLADRAKGLDRREGCCDCGWERISGVFSRSEIDESSEKWSKGRIEEVGSLFGFGGAG